MISLKTKREIQLMEDAGRLLADCHKEIEQRIKPGVSTKEIDRFVETYLKKKTWSYSRAERVYGLQVCLPVPV